MNRFLLMEGVAAMQIPTMVWPAYSPDFNPIETIWSWMKLLSNVDWKLVSSNISRRFIKSWMHGRTVYRLAYEVVFSRRIPPPPSATARSTMTSCPTTTNCALPRKRTEDRCSLG